MRGEESGAGEGDSTPRILHDGCMLVCAVHLLVLRVLVKEGGK